MKSRATAWICPKCGNTVKLTITPTAPPTCRNHKGARAVTMQQAES